MVVRPPSAVIVAPVTKLARALATKAMDLADFIGLSGATKGGGLCHSA